MSVETLFHALAAGSVRVGDSVRSVAELAGVAVPHPVPWAPRERVAVVDERGASQLEAVFAIWQSGGVPILGASDAELEAWHGPGVLWRWPGHRVRQGRCDEADDATAFVHRTSGSTGKAKFARRSFASLMREAEGYGALYGLRARDRAFLAAPIEHSFGFGAAFGVMMAGGVLDLAPTFLPRTLARRLTDGKTDVVVLTPTMAQLALQAAPNAESEHPVRCVIAGAGPVPDRLNEAFRHRFGVPIARNYGSSETGATLGMTDHSGESVVGRPFPGIRILAPCSGEAGELVLDLGTAALGYEGMPPDAGQGAGRWRTHDLATVDEEGCVSLLGRLDDRVKINGSLVDLGELARLAGSLPGVREAVALAEGRQDRPESADLVVFCAAEPDRAPGIAAAIGAASGCVASVRLVDTLPRTAAGKPDTAALRRLLLKSVMPDAPERVPE